MMDDGGTDDVRLFGNTRWEVLESCRWCEEGTFYIIGLRSIEVSEEADVIITDEVDGNSTSPSAAAAAGVLPRIYFGQAGR